MYRRPASRYKRTPYAKKREEEQEELPVVVESEDIAMPNEAEIPALPLADDGTDMSAIRLMGHDFFLDDIILIGLLIILIQENVQDELLLIVIVYILLF